MILGDHEHTRWIRVWPWDWLASPVQLKLRVGCEDFVRPGLQTQMVSLPRMERLLLLCLREQQTDGWPRQNEYLRKRVIFHVREDNVIFLLIGCFKVCYLDRSR